MSDVPVAHQTVRVEFDTYLAAAEALLCVLEDARTTDCTYQITGLSLDKILKSGMVLQGDVADILSQVAVIPGARIV